MLGYYTNGSDGASQADYDLTIAASPADEHSIFEALIHGNQQTVELLDGKYKLDSKPTYNITGVPKFMLINIYLLIRIIQTCLKEMTEVYIKQQTAELTGQTYKRNSNQSDLQDRYFTN
ncbi:MAG: hypothetical protein R2942_10480 [Ignavibacteria bacterium]